MRANRMALTCGLLIVAALLPLLAGCGAAGAMMNRDNKDLLRDRSKDERDTNLSKETPPSIQQNREGAAGGGEAAPDGGHQIMAMGDDAIERLTAMYEYLSATEAERATMLDLSSWKKLNLFGYAITGVILAVLIWIIWRKTAKLRAAAKAGLLPIGGRIKALVESARTEPDAERKASINARIVELSGLEYDGRKKMNGGA